MNELGAVAEEECRKPVGLAWTVLKNFKWLDSWRVPPRLVDSSWLRQVDWRDVVWFDHPPLGEPTYRGLAESCLLGPFGHGLGKAAACPFGLPSHSNREVAWLRCGRMEDSPLPRMSRPLPRRKLEATPVPRVWLASFRNLPRRKLEATPLPRVWLASSVVLLCLSAFPYFFEGSLFCFVISFRFSMVCALFVFAFAIHA